MCLVNNCINGLAPSYLSNLLEFVDVHGQHTRATGRHDLVLNLTRTKAGDKAFWRGGPLCWNSLSLDVRNGTTINNFKYSYLSGASPGPDLHDV